jgi:hypothetical protein
MPTLFKRISSFRVNPGVDIFAGVKRNASAGERASAPASSSIAYRIGCGDGGSNLTARDGMLSSTGHGFAKLTTYEPFKYVSWVLVFFIGTRFEYFDPVAAVKDDARDRTRTRQVSTSLGA